MIIIVLYRKYHSTIRITGPRLSWLNPLTWRWGWILLILFLLPALWPLGKYFILAWIAGMDYNVRGTDPSTYGVLPTKKQEVIGPKKPIQLNENENRYQFFVDTPRKLGWQTLPTEVRVDVPLDGVPRYAGTNIALLGRAKVKIDCPGYRSGGAVKLFAKADDENWVHLGNSNSFTLQDTGAVNGGGALLVKGVREGVFRGDSNPIEITVGSVRGHERIATTKVCESGSFQPWGTIQVGNAQESPHWTLYLRFADPSGQTIQRSVMQQKPGEVFLSVMEKTTTNRTVFREVVSKPANVYEKGIKPFERDLLLGIHVPDITWNDGSRSVIVEVILDIDNT